MQDEAQRIKDFVEFVATLDGDEKSEAQLFCERLFKAFGWPGLKEAGATLEHRVAMRTPDGKTRTKFADLLWPSKLLIEMKRRGEKLDRHYQQAFEYWQHIVPHRPQYVILCNFDEFWIYDFNIQLYDPVDRITSKNLPAQYSALNFLFPDERRPHFGNNRIDVTRIAADKVATVFNLLSQRGTDRDQAQRFVLQCVVALFAEDIGLLPANLFTELIDECLSGASSFDLLGNMFRWMNTPTPARGGRYRGVPYFNGGLFAVVDPLDLNREELELLAQAATENWSKVQPAIFGTLFQNSMDKELRHALGAHFTSEAEIQRVILPTIVRPWRDRIAAAKTREELIAIRAALERYRVLDPACGSGNFLYVAYREMVRIEMDLVKRLHAEFPSARSGKRKVASVSFLSVMQFYGIDISSFAAELAKVTLLLGKKLAYDEVTSSLNVEQLGLTLEPPLPLDNLDGHVICDDALFCKWPQVDAIIGNPPYQSKTKMQDEFGADYVTRVRRRYPDVPGRADYCVYWFRRAHDELQPDCRAGLVGTNTIRQNYSREGGLDYIVTNGGTITEAVSSQVWPGEAVVHVSIVNWIKGSAPGKKLIFTQVGDYVDSPWTVDEVERIQAALSASTDVTKVTPLEANRSVELCCQGQTHGHEGFLLSPDEAAEILKDPTSKGVVHPYLIGDDLVGRSMSQPSRFVIDLNGCNDVTSAMRHRTAFNRIKSLVYHDIQQAAEKERDATNKSTGPRQAHAQRWWKHWRGRGDLIHRLESMSRYIACSRITRRPIFEFVSTKIRPNDKIQVFAMEDDYSFGIISSSIHWEWFKARCTTLKADFNYNAPAIWWTFPWPQSPTIRQAKTVAQAAVDLRALRRELMAEHNWTLRQLYSTLESTGKNRLKDAIDALDSAVRAAYGIRSNQDPLRFLLNLNASLVEQESSGRRIAGPGLPPCVLNVEEFTTSDCVEFGTRRARS